MSSRIAEESTPTASALARECGMDAGNAQAACLRGLLHCPGFRNLQQEKLVWGRKMWCKLKSGKPTTKSGFLIEFELSGAGQQLTGRTLGNSAGQDCCWLVKVHDTWIRSLIVGLGMKLSHQKQFSA